MNDGSDAQFAVMLAAAVVGYVAGWLSCKLKDWKSDKDSNGG